MIRVNGSAGPRGVAARAVFGALLLAVAGCDRGSATGVTLRPDDAEVVTAGKANYAARCASCHGVAMEGQPQWRQRDARGRFPAPPHDASGHTWHHPDDLLFKLTKYGVAKASNLRDYESDMPAFEGVLSDAEIVAVLSSIKAQWPADIRQHQEEMNAARPSR
ncbi:MAG: cytochrome c [Pseudomonadota bacterium]|nr:cytochrome c [Pseudomonadota bacterium]